MWRVALVAAVSNSFWENRWYDRSRSIWCLEKAGNRQQCDDVTFIMCEGDCGERLNDQQKTVLSSTGQYQNQNQKYQYQYQYQRQSVCDVTLTLTVWVVCKSFQSRLHRQVLHYPIRLLGAMQLSYHDWNSTESNIIDDIDWCLSVSWPQSTCRFRLQAS